MATGCASLEARKRTEDVLAQLPISNVTEYGKRQVIYDPARVSSSIYLVLSGTVGITHIGDSGGEILLEVVRPDEMFGESAFLDQSCCERATSMERVRLMTWAISDIEELVTKRPRLAVALLQILAQRNADFTRRIESFASDNVEKRLARSLLDFSGRLGTRTEDGTVRIMALTHETLSRYVGTSRELVTQIMNRFRREGHVTYSRQGIVCNPESLRTLLDRSVFASARGQAANPLAVSQAVNVSQAASF